MAELEMARRTEISVSIGGVDITRDMRPYLLGLTYTDNEEDETDDLQIDLQDRGASGWRSGWRRPLRGRRLLS